MTTPIASEASIPPLPTPAADRQSRPRSAMINASWNAFATFWNIAISFVLTPLLIHRLGTAHYGMLLVIWSVTGVLGIVSFGLGEGTLRYVAHYYADGNLTGVNRVFRSTLTFYVVVCGVVALALGATAPLVVTWLSISADQQELVAWLLRLSAVSFFCSVISCGAFAAIPMALQRYDISSTISILQSVARSIGLVFLAVKGFGILHLVAWDLIVQLATLCIHVIIARRLLPTLRPLPSFSLQGLKEIFGYSVFSFLTHIFHAMYRESGKLALGARMGPSPVAYFGTPDGVAYRIYMVLVSGGETLMPRFSANRDTDAARGLLLNATWASLALSIVLFVPLATLMPDFLRLWISPEFARHSAVVGQLLVLSYIAPAAFAPIATFFRGTGKPWIVTAVMAGAGITTLVACMLLIPRYAVVGVGYAYLLSSVPWLVGFAWGWVYAFGRSSLVGLARSAVLPVLLGSIVYLLAGAARDRLGELTWFGLFGLGGLLACLTALLLFGADWALGGDPPSRKLLQRIAECSKVDVMLRRLSFGCVR